MESQKNYTDLTIKYNVSRFGKHEIIIVYSGDIAIASTGTGLKNCPRLSEYTRIEWDTNIQVISVKRIDDGEILSIGDVINFNNYGTGKLLKIEYECAPVDKGTGRLTFISDNSVLGKWWNINVLHKINLRAKVSDGEVTYGDIFYAISNNKIISDIYKGGDLDSTKVFFLKKENAENHLVFNSSCLSINDIAKVYVTANRKIPKPHSSYERQAIKLQEMVKKKLNLE